MNFKKNKNYFSLLRKETESRWICDNPLFTSKDKGLFPVYECNGKYGIMNKNYKELILKDIKQKSNSKKVLKEWNI